jgi:hypothetical protein
MLKVLFVGFVLVLLGSAAQASCPNRGTFAYCPPGKCGYYGQKWACDIRYCLASNCRK